jgi:hypothetical protein
MARCHHGTNQVGSRSDIVFTQVDQTTGLRLVATKKAVVATGDAKIIQHLHVFSLPEETVWLCVSNRVHVLH